jgi:hypothetical protein
MQRSSVGALVLALFLGTAACERPEEQPYVVPPGVSVDPPRAAPEAGSITLPGAQPDTVLEATEPPGATDPPDAPVAESPAVDPGP